MSSVPGATGGHLPTRTSVRALAAFGLLICALACNSAELLTNDTTAQPSSYGQKLLPYAHAHSPDGRWLITASHVGASVGDLTTLAARGRVGQLHTLITLADLSSLRVYSQTLAAQNVDFRYATNSQAILITVFNRILRGGEVVRVDVGFSGATLSERVPVFGKLSPRELHRYASSTFGSMAILDRVRPKEVLAGHAGSLSADGKRFAFRNCVFSDGAAPDLCNQQGANVAIAPDGRTVATDDGALRSWPMGEPLFRGLPKKPNVSYAPTFSPSSRYVAWVPIFEGYNQFYDTADIPNVIVQEVHSGRLAAIADGKNIESANWLDDEVFALGRANLAGGVELVSTTGDLSKLESRTWKVGNGPIRSVARCGKNCLSAIDASGSIVLRDTVHDKEIARVFTFPTGILAHTPTGFFSTTSPALAEQVEISTTAGPINMLQLWDTFYRPDILLGLDSLDKASLIDETVANKLARIALEQPAPTVALELVRTGNLAKRAVVKYIQDDTGGGVGEVRYFHNGKLVMSDGLYKDALGKLPAASSQLSPGTERVTLRSAIPLATRRASMSESPVQMQQGLGTTVASASSMERPADLVVRGAPEKKCNPCTGEIEIDVIAGEENTVTVVAFNRDNTIQSLPASVTFKSTLPKEEPRLWVLAAGINQFQDMSALKNARKDAADFACAYVGREALQKAGLTAAGNCSLPGSALGLFKAENIHIVDVQLDERATRKQMLAKLDEIATKARPQDTFVWFVASHGMMDSNGLFGIVAHDTRCTAQEPKSLACNQLQGHITSNDILEASKKIKAMKQLMVLDTCHSGGLDNKLSGLYDARMSVLAKNMGLHLFASAQATEVAQDGDPGTNGAFTAQLLAGLKGAAKVQANGDITVVALGEYAREKTIEATQAQGRKVRLASASEATNTVATPKQSSTSSTATTSAAANEAVYTQTPVIQHFGVDTPVARRSAVAK